MNASPDLDAKWAIAHTENTATSKRPKMSLS
jgi:hypothetical protein